MERRRQLGDVSETVMIAEFVIHGGIDAIELT